MSTFVKLKAHEAARKIPRHGDLTREGLKMDVKQHGLKEPGTHWVNEDKEKILIDGISRQDVISELLSEEIEKSDSGVKIEFWTEAFEGTEEDVLDFIESKNIHRRDLTSSQRAGIAVQNFGLRRKYHARVTGEKAPKVEHTTDWAEALAQKYGTNRPYIFDCMKIAEQSDSLLSDVVSGASNVPQAKSAAGRLARGLPAYDEEVAAGPTSETTPEPAPEPPAPTVWCDGLKMPVPDEFAHIFSVRSEVRDMIKQIKKVSAEAEAYSNGPGGATVDQKSILSDFRGLVATLRNTQPHCICPYCTGTGKSGEGSKKKCPNCKGAQYLDSMQYKVLPDDIKASVPSSGDSSEE